MNRQSPESFNAAHAAHLEPIDTGDEYCKHCDANLTDTRSRACLPCDTNEGVCTACCSCDDCSEHLDTLRRSYTTVQACNECQRFVTADLLWHVIGYGDCCPTCIEKIRDLGLTG